MTTKKAGMTTTQIIILVIVFAMNLGLLGFGASLIIRDNSATQIPILVPASSTPVPIPTLAPFPTSTNAPRPTGGLPQETADYAYDVAFVDREYGGQYIVSGTAKILNYIEIPDVKSSYGEQTLRAICINYKFSAVQIDGSVVNDIHRAMMIFWYEDGRMSHQKLLDRETC